jgi:hypothetical protein
MGGMSGQLGQSLVDTGVKFGGKAPSSPVSSAGYTPVQSNPYAPAFSSTQTLQGQPVMSPFARQMAQQYTPIQSAGIAAMMSALTNQQPQQQSGIAGLPAYRPAALSYRPDMQAVRQNLSRPVPSVYKTELDAARARIAELEAVNNQPVYTGYEGSNY